MENIEAKNKSFKRLKILFLISLIVTVLAFIYLIIVTAISESGALAQGGGEVIVVFDWIFAVLKALVIFSIIIVVLVGRKFNKFTKTSLWLAVGCVAFGVAGFCVQGFGGQWALGNSLTLIGAILYACSVFVFVDGLLEHKWKKEPWVRVTCLGLSFMVIAQVTMFIATSIKVGRAFNGALAFIAATLFVVCNLLLFISIKQIGESVKKIGPEPVEEKQ